MNDGDLISRSALLQNYEQFLARASIDPVIRAFMTTVCCTVKNAPAVDAEPVRHGRWFMRGGYIRCSECDAKTLWKDAGGTGGFSHEYEQVRANYCPNCGARMDGDEHA